MHTAVAIVALVLAADSKPTGYFQSARWGMSKDQVQMLFPDAHRTKVEAVLRNERRTSIGTVVVEFRYFFFGPKGLIGVSLYDRERTKTMSPSWPRSAAGTARRTRTRTCRPPRGSERTAGSSPRRMWSWCST